MKFKFILSSLSILSALAGVTTAQLDSPSNSNISSNLTTEHAEHAEHAEHTANHTNNMPMTMPMTMTMESLNETEILIKHGADSMSFYEYDYESDNSSKPAWMIMHAIGMTFSFAILLPFALALKASHSSLYGLVNLLFLITISTSTAFSTIYKKLTPDLYSHSAHGKLGWFTLFLIAALSGYDSFRFLQKAWTWYKSTNYKSLNSFKVNVLEDVDRAPPSNHSQAENDNIPLYETTHLHDYDDEADSPASSDSRRSEMTLNDDQPEHLAKLNYSSLKLSWKERGLAIAHYLKLTLDRTTFPLGFAGVTTGVVSYSGICHATYLNGCLAHLIKGGIFFGYGLLTFGRYCGAYADIGWAWNLTPRRSLRNWKARCVSAEFVECLVIFTYGCTNTFMERFGAKAGDPWSMKQVQHASIAVMFFFVGGLGLLIELRSVRRLFGSYRPDQPNPNPFPALAIGITGFAMASHHQEYAFAVSQHALFGNFLALFALCRCSTYALTYLSPITSERPTKPVTELLASFFLSAGGIAFMFSIEQFTFAAYRRGFAHLMFLLNLVISLTALCIFCVALTMVVKSWSARESTGSNKGLLFDASEAGGEDDDEGVDGVDEANVHQHDRLTHTHAQSHSHDQPV